MQVMPDKLRELLYRTSRTFALNIPKLPSPLEESVTIGYLLFRNADTIEDAYRLSKDERIAALEQYISVLENRNDRALVSGFAQQFSDEDRIDDSDHVTLLQYTPYLMDQLNELPEEYQKIIVEHVIRTSRGMQLWMQQFDGHNQLSLLRLKQLDDYCYTVAGIVGEMLTTLFSLYSPFIREGRLLYLRTLELGFAAGLQLTNIIKDSFRDHNEGRHYIPPQFIPLNSEEDSDRVIPMLTYAFRHLAQGIEYVLGLPDEEDGIRQFCLIPLALAASTLDQILLERDALYSGEDVKITRKTVFELLDAVEHVVVDNSLIRQWWHQLTSSLTDISLRFTDPLVAALTQER
ncbi:MAG: squalene/phytoene synthase family protein [Chloroflexota bacterium]